jgi:hypothetical protein
LANLFSIGVVAIGNRNHPRLYRRDQVGNAPA